MNYLLLLIPSLLLFSCTNQSGNTIATHFDRDSVLSVLIETDKKWNETAMKKGFNHSRIDYADSNAINLLGGEMPLIGIKSIIKYANDNPEVKEVCVNSKIKYLQSFVLTSKASKILGQKSFDY